MWYNWRLYKAESKNPKKAADKEPSIPFLAGWLDPLLTKTTISTIWTVAGHAVAKIARLISSSPQWGRPTLHLRMHPQPQSSLHQLLHLHHYPPHDHHTSWLLLRLPPPRSTVAERKIWIAAIASWFLPLPPILPLSWLKTKSLACIDYSMSTARLWAKVELPSNILSVTFFFTLFLTVKSTDG